MRAYADKLIEILSILEADSTLSADEAAHAEHLAFDLDESDWSPSMRKSLRAKIASAEAFLKKHRVEL